MSIIGSLNDMAMVQREVTVVSSLAQMSWQKKEGSKACHQNSH